MKRIKRFGVIQTAKVAALIYFIVFAIFCIPIGLISNAIGQELFPEMAIGGTFLVIVPFLYAVFAFIVTAISCWIYNLIASWIGGIEVQLETFGKNTDTPSGR